MVDQLSAMVTQVITHVYLDNAKYKNIVTKWKM